MAIKTFITALALIGCTTLALAAKDVIGKPPVMPPAQSATEKAAPRCAPPAVQECRATCDKRPADAATPKGEVARRVQECKSSCLEGC